MKDLKLDERINNYRKCNLDFKYQIENNHLSLRKKQVNEIINHSRMKDWKKSNDVLQIDVDCLKVDHKHKNFMISDIVYINNLE